MVGNIRSDNPISGGNFVIVEDVPPLLTVRACAMLAKKRDAFATFLKIHSILDILNLNINVMATCTIEPYHC
jgi:hypothetical protein